MVYEICDTCLLFPIQLSRSECASWVQAWGSILAIIMSVSVAFWQMKKQHKNTLNALKEQKKQEYLRSAETISEIAKCALKLTLFFAASLSTPARILEATQNKLPLDIPQLLAMEEAILRIELHLLPASLVRLAIMLSGTVRQFRQHIEKVTSSKREMSEADFNNFSRALAEMNESLTLTAHDFENEYNRLSLA